VPPLAELDRWINSTFRSEWVNQSPSITGKAFKTYLFTSYKKKRRGRGTMPTMASTRRQSQSPKKGRRSECWKGQRRKSKFGRYLEKKKRKEKLLTCSQGLFHCVGTFWKCIIQDCNQKLELSIRRTKSFERTKKKCPFHQFVGKQWRSPSITTSSFSTGRKVELWNIHESDSFLISH
jgi:hypothetical protein